jgi:hypothetical protein
MRTHTHRSRALAAMIVAFGALATAGPSQAHAAAVPISGTQTVVDENAGTFKMHGSLVGDWAVTSFNVLDTSPVMHAKGTERFSGCLDRGRDGSCKGDPSGTLRFTIDYHALFDPPGSQNLVWGTCYHPVAGGTGAFAGARGVIAMADTPTADGVSTSYIGNLTLAGGDARGRAGHARASAASVRRGCGR